MRGQGTSAQYGMQAEHAAAVNAWAGGMAGDGCCPGREPEMLKIEEIVSRGAQSGVSDIHIVEGVPVKGRVDGRFMDLTNEPLTDEDCQTIARQLEEGGQEHLGKIGQLDLARTIAGSRVRINLYRQRGHISAALRILSDHIPDLRSLGLPPAALTFPSYQKGIVLVTGETGSGKSTTLAAILDEINHTRQEHIITLEDPVEYIYTMDKCIINQREIGTDTESYEAGLRAILREDPDVILIGEMRDPSSMETAMTAAETGHLVFATLHTNSAPESVDRIVDTFPAERQQQIRMQLSVTLKAILSQQLLIRKGGKGRIVACECMINTPAIANLIRENKTPQMYSSMLSSANLGSITMDNCLLRMVAEGSIDSKTALEAANDKAYLQKKLMF